jgi:hypothetical protein
MKRGIFVTAAILMLLIGFGAAFVLIPVTAKTITSTYTTTFTSTQSGDPVNCVVYGHQVYGHETTFSNGSSTLTITTASGLATDYTTVTSVQHQPGYMFTTTVTYADDSLGPGWNSTVCTWLPAS